MPISPRREVLGRRRPPRHLPPASLPVRQVRVVPRGPGLGLGPTVLRNLRRSRRRSAVFGTEVSSARSADTHASRLEVARGWLRNRHHLAVEAAALIFVYLVYDLSRGLVSGAGALADRHGRQVAHAEQHLSLYIEPSVQHALQRVPGLFYVFGFGYDVFHIGVTAVVLVWIYLRRPHAFPAIRTTLIASVSLALVVFAFYPTAPPRMAQLGIGDSLALSHHTSQSPVLSALYNPYAAMPSLHMVFAVITGASIAVYARHRWAKIAGLVYPLFVAAEVVATGNHYLLDLAAGAATVAISAVATRRVLRPAVPIVTASPRAWLQPSTPCIADRAQQAELSLRGSTRSAGETLPPPPFRPASNGDRTTVSP
jgi:membrane-associated phospholipid phosphatase